MRFCGFIWLQSVGSPHHIYNDAIIRKSDTQLWTTVLNSWSFRANSDTIMRNRTINYFMFVANSDHKQSNAYKCCLSLQTSVEFQLSNKQNHMFPKVPSGTLGSLDFFGCIACVLLMKYLSCLMRYCQSHAKSRNTTINYRYVPCELWNNYGEQMRICGFQTPKRVRLEFDRKTRTEKERERERERKRKRPQATDQER